MMITQNIEMKGVYPEHVWVCAGCEAELTSIGGPTRFEHEPGCLEVASIVVQVQDGWEMRRKLYRD
jgi:hypothetical protein